MKRVSCYIDGFNLYHAIHDLQKPHLKWTNLYSLAESLTRENETLVAVNYFSAYVTWIPASYARHRQYVAALKHYGVNVVLAHFKEKQRSCKRCGNQWISREEKETDVRLALKMLEDAEDDVFDRAIVISADSDLVPPAESIIQRHPEKKIFIAIPPGRHSHCRDLRNAAGSSTLITKGRLGKHLLDAVITDSSGSIIAQRPPEYDPPA